MKNLKDVPQDALFVMADVVGSYPSIPHEAGLKALKEALNKRENSNIATNDRIKIAKFVFKNSKYLEQPLVPNLHLHTLPFLWMTLKVNFLKLNHYNL